MACIGLTLCPWVILHVFLSSADFFFQINFFGNTNRKSNSLQQGQAKYFIELTCKLQIPRLKCSQISVLKIFHVNKLNKK